MNERDKAIQGASLAIGEHVERLLQYTTSGTYRRGYLPDSSLAFALDLLQEALDTLIYAYDDISLTLAGRD